MTSFIKFRVLNRKKLSLVDGGAPAYRCRMRIRDMALAALTSVIWGFAFVTYKFGLESFGPLRFAGMALILAGLAVIVWPVRNGASLRGGRSPTKQSSSK